MNKLQQIAAKYKFNLDVAQEVLRREGYITIDSYGAEKAYYSYKNRKFLNDNKNLIEQKNKREQEFKEIKSRAETAN